MKPMWRLHVPSRMRLVEPPLTTKLVVPRRKIVGKLSEVVGSVRKAVGNFPSCIARYLEKFQPISDEYFRLRHPIMHCALKNRVYKATLIKSNFRSSHVVKGKGLSLPRR